MKFSACIELLFAEETSDFADRIRMAGDAGLDGIEFWRWTNKNLGALEKALQETGLPVTGLVADPMVPMTDARWQVEFVAGLQGSIETARRLGASILIAQTGTLLGTPRTEQRQALTDCLRHAADRLDGSGVVLAILDWQERLNWLVRAGYRGFVGLSIGQPEVPLIASGFAISSGSEHAFHRVSAGLKAT